MEETIRNISDYIKKVSELVSKKGKETIVVYRGEGEIYSTHCQPNLFRGNYLKRNIYFEKNLFDEMTANKLTSGESYLEKSIDAQHGGFPSRLLDVTYNSLVALYFAVTPEINKAEDTLDGKDGIVYIYFIEKLFCPSGDNINLIYDSIIKRDKEWFSDNEIFQKNHKLIDHIKTNKRIIAQQGAFILFQGDMVSPIPQSDYKKIRIDGNYKNKIRQDLKNLFGIHTGSIYPEPSNLVKHITNKSYIVNCNKFDFNAELDLVISNFEREVDFFGKDIITEIYDKEIEVQITRKIMKIEEIITTYKGGIEELKEKFNSYKLKTNNEKNENGGSMDESGKGLKKQQEKIEEIIERYNKLIREFYQSINCHISELKIEFSIEELIIRRENDEK